jgi:predicted transcriptional regulator YdeE
MQFKTEIHELEKPINVFCVTAESFPEGIGKAHEKLHSVARNHPERRYYGISWGGPAITYMAAAEELEDGELRDKDLEEFTIRAGKYLSVTINGFDRVKDVFQELIHDPRIDLNGYCVEIYLEGSTVQCMATMRE